MGQLCAFSFLQLQRMAPSSCPQQLKDILRQVGDGISHTFICVFALAFGLLNKSKELCDCSKCLILPLKPQLKP